MSKNIRGSEYYRKINPIKKLTEKQIEEIRRSFENNMVTIDDLVKIYKVSRSTIYYHVKGYKRFVHCTSESGRHNFQPRAGVAMICNSCGVERERNI